MKLSELNRIGNTSLEITAMGLGTAGVAGLYQYVPIEQAVLTILTAWKAGVRYFDTAPFYGFGRGEHILGSALRKLKELGASSDCVVSTKAGRLLKRRPSSISFESIDGWSNPMPFEPIFDYSYQGIMRSYEDSLQRLGLSKIDILLVHDIGSYTHGEKHSHYWKQLSNDGGFRALQELRANGDISAVGFGVNETSIILDALMEFDLNCCLLAGRYTLLEQLGLEDLFTICEKKNVSIILGGVFNSGILARGGKSSSNINYNYSTAPQEILDRVIDLEKVCSKHEVPLASVALQFPYAHRQVASIVTGARSPDEVAESISWFEKEIDPMVWEELLQSGLINSRFTRPRQL